MEKVISKQGFEGLGVIFIGTNDEGRHVSKRYNTNKSSESGDSRVDM